MLGNLTWLRIAMALFVGVSVIFVSSQLAFRARAAKLEEAIQSRYWKAKSDQYSEFVTEEGVVSKNPAFAWDMAVQMSALAAACRVDKKYARLFEKAQNALDGYGANASGIFGYAVLPHQLRPDRYYDDNEWIALAQLDAYDATENRRYLRLAQKTFAFVLSGLSNDLGGGIFWREADKKSKNTCSNAPAIAVAARLYMATKSATYLKTAETLHKWVERLKDSDNLMFDNVSLAGKFDRTKWTYNAALMIRSDLLLYKAAGDPHYLSEAKEIAMAAKLRWSDPITGAIKDEACFAHHLAEAFLDLEPRDPGQGWKEIAERAISHAYRNCGKGGLYGARWDRYESPDRKLALLYQGSMARALWLAAGQ